MSLDAVTFFDIDVAPNGTAVTVWYDQGSASLKLAHNATPLVTPDAWTERAVAVATSAGTHVAMEIDPAGGIRLSYLDTSSGYLKYSYLASYDAVTVTSVFVDALFSSGQYNGITIRNFGTVLAPDYRPVISTYSTTFGGTNGAVRVAWPESPLNSLADGANSATGRYTGAWEVKLVPAATPAGATRTFVEPIVATGMNRVTVGYNGEYVEEATYLGWD